MGPGHGECFMQSMVTKQGEMPNAACQSSGWRFSRTQYVECYCSRAREDNKACEAWSCTATKPDEYPEKTVTVCRDNQSIGKSFLGPGIGCGAWHSMQIARPGKTVPDGGPKGADIGLVSECRVVCEN